MLERLRHTYNTKANINEQEEIYIQGWSIIEKDMLTLMDKSWSFQKRGKQKTADILNEAANTLVYLFYYAYFIRKWLDNRGLIDDQCTATSMESQFKVACVEDNLPCLSANYDVDYVSIWKELISVFGITRQSVGCESDCCLGISEMEIDSNNDCIGFIIGSCDENETEDVELLGDYEDCAYDDSHYNGENEPCN